MSPTKRPIATNLALVRRVNGWSLDEIAVPAGISRDHLSRIERGLAKPSQPTLLKIAAVAGISADSALKSPGLI